MTMMTSTLMKATRSVASMGLLALVTLAGSGTASAQLVDTSFEVFRIRCQIDIDIDPVTGLEVPKVQIQAKARADLLDTDWDTFPDALDPNPVATIPGDFVVDGEQIQVHARDTSVFGSGQQVTDVAECASKVSAQFRQQTKPPKICDMPGDEDKLAEGKCVLE
jgi:hypothetical protein